MEEEGDGRKKGIGRRKSMEVSSVVHALKKKQDFLHEGFQRSGDSAGQRGEISVQCFRDSGQHLKNK